jgi:hypothetical protein
MEEFYSVGPNAEIKIVRVTLDRLTRWAKSPWGC